jgi:hypothetical protein
MNILHAPDAKLLLVDDFAADSGQMMSALGSPFARRQTYATNLFRNHLRRRSEQFFCGESGLCAARCQRAARISSVCRRITMAGTAPTCFARARRDLSFGTGGIDSKAAVRQTSRVGVGIVSDLIVKKSRLPELAPWDETDCAVPGRSAALYLGDAVSLAIALGFLAGIAVALLLV